MRSCMPQKQPPARMAVSVWLPTDAPSVVVCLIQHAAARGSSHGSPEGEDGAPHPRVKNLDLEQAVLDPPRLADELVHALVVRGAVPALVDVEAGGGARRLAVESDPEANGCLV